MRRRAIALVLLALATGPVSVLGGCTSVRNTLGTNASPCFRALAVAKEAVHDRGTFTGVHLVSSKTLAQDAHLEDVLSARAGMTVKTVCVVSYRGSFRLDQVERPFDHVPRGGVGRYAIVVVSEPQNRLLGTAVRSRQPLRFGHVI